MYNNRKPCNGLLVLCFVSRKRSSLYDLLLVVLELHQEAKSFYGQENQVFQDPTLHDGRSRSVHCACLKVLVIVQSLHGQEHELSDVFSAEQNDLRIPHVEIHVDSLMNLSYLYLPAQMLAEHREV